MRICGSAWARMRLTTLAGISSTRSAASSTYSSLTTSCSSRSEKPRISSSCHSLSSSAKVSAAVSLGSCRNSSGMRSSSRSSNTAAISAGSMVTRISFRV